MRQLKILAAGCVLMFAAAGSIRGEDDAFSTLPSDTSLNIWDSCQQLPISLHMPSADLMMPLFVTAGAGEPNCNLDFCSSLNCGTVACGSGDRGSFICGSFHCDSANCNSGSCGSGNCGKANCGKANCGKECLATDKCESLDPATAAFIAEHRKNSPAARFCEALDVRCMLGCGQNADCKAGYAAACSPPAVVPTIVAAPVYTPPPVYVHPPICAQPPMCAQPPVCAQPMSLAYRPSYLRSAPTPYSTVPANPYSPGYAYAASCDGCQATCKCASCNCGASCKCGANCKCGAGHQCNSSQTACNCAGKACQCQTAACKCQPAAAPCDMAACQCKTPAAQCASGCCAKSEDCNAAQARLEHMLEASRHLELAGMKNEAEKLREECVGEVSKLMRRLKAAEAELAQLRKSAPAAKTVHRDVPAASPCSYAPDSACFKPTCEQGKQVVVEVQMIEIDRNKLTNMGFDFAYIDDAGEPCSGSAVDAVFNAAGKPRVAGCDTTRFGVLDDVKGLMGFLEALKQEEAAKVLSQPTVTTMIGRAAAFQIGGEFPVPTPQNDGATTIEYKTFGTELNLLPLMTEDNKLRLEMRARVSELDMSREVQVAGQSVPGLKVRQIDTGVEMKPGQTWIVGGMATNRNEGGKQTPVELLMIIKPEIVEPTKCATACKAAPCAKCECNPCGNCKPASHEESSPVPMPSF